MNIDINKLPLPNDSPEEKKLRLQQDLELIIRSCLGEFKNIKSIILYGGYGREEGSWIQNKDKWSPYNDYDIVVITQKKISKKRIDQLKKELAKKIKINWVDLSQKTQLRLRLMQKTIYSYDLKNASTVLWGDEKVLDLIPVIDASKLPSYEIVTLFFTRLWPFIGGINKYSFEHGLAGEPSRFFRNQMAKAALATVDVVLLMHNAYTPSYVKRVGLSLDYFDAFEAEIVKWALNEKLKPQEKTMSGKEVLEMYDNIHALYSKIMKKGLSFHFGKKVKNYLDIEKKYSKSRNLSILRLLHLFNRKSSNYDKVTEINILQAHLFFSYIGNKNFDLKILNEAVKNINNLPYTHKNINDWYTASELVSHIRNNI